MSCSESPEDDLVAPVTDTASLDAFCDDFHLERRSEPGLSVVVPYCREEITPDSIMQAVAREYFFPILNGKLIVVVERAEPDGMRRRLDSNSLLDSIESDASDLDGDLGSLISILVDPTTSDELSIAVEIEPGRLPTALEVAEYLWRILAPLRASERQSLDHDPGLWSWRALLWFQQLCPPDANGRRRPGEGARWIPELDDARRYYRHLLLGPYLIYRTHEATPELVEAVLCNALHVGTGEVFRTIVETQQFVTSAPVIALIRRLYYDGQRGRLIRGAATKRAGGVRRLGDVLSQLDRTFDLHSIEVDALISLLPKEFLEIEQRHN